MENNCLAKSRGKLQGHVLQSNPPASSPASQQCILHPGCTDLLMGRVVHGKLLNALGQRDRQRKWNASPSVPWGCPGSCPAPAGAHRKLCVTSAQCPSRPHKSPTCPGLAIVHLALGLFPSSILARARYVTAGAAHTLFLRSKAWNTAGLTKYMEGLNESWSPLQKK